MKALTKVLTNNESIDEKKMQQLKYWSDDDFKYSIEKKLFVVRWVFFFL